MLKKPDRRRASLLSKKKILYPSEHSGIGNKHDIRIPPVLYVSDENSYDRMLSMPSGSIVLTPT